MSGGGRRSTVWALDLLLRAVSLLSPGRVRARWLEEWRAEVWHALDRPPGERRSTLALLWRCVGAIPDALASRRLAPAGGIDAMPSRRRDAFAQDVRLGGRMLLRRPGFAVLALAMLSLGVGANAAIFGLVRAALLRPLPFVHEDGVVQLWETRPHQGRERNPVSLPDFIDWRARARTIERMAAWENASYTLSGERAERIEGAAVTWELASVLGVKPMLGRTFIEDEDRPGAPGAVVLSHALWADRFASDPGIIGRTVVLDLVPATIVGVLPAGFDFPLGSRLWTPLAGDPTRRSRGSHSLLVVGRLAPDATLADARTDIMSITKSLEAEYPQSNLGHYANAYLMRDEYVQGTRPALLLLMGALALLLAIVCVNVANMQLARGETRAREMAIRRALGAARGRLVHQLVTENLVLAVCAAIVAIGVAAVARRLLLVLVADEMPWLAAGGLDPVVLLYSFALSIGASFAFGIVPALRTSRAPGVAAIGSDRVLGRSPPGRLRDALVVSEVALAALLLIASVLLSRSLFALMSVEPGFDASHALVADIALPGQRYTAADSRRFYADLETRVRALPGVGGVGFTTILPMSGREAGRNFSIEGRAAPENGDMLNGRIRIVSAGYFDAIGMRVLSGRGIEATDDQDAPPVVVINRTMARQYWADADPLGALIRFSESEPPLAVVGIVNDVHHNGPGEPVNPEIFLSQRQRTVNAGTMVVRTSAAPMSLLPALRSVVREIDPDVPLAGVNTLDSFVDSAVGRPRALAELVAIFAILSALLAGLGIYGVVSFSVAQRTREFGVRLALGGEPRAMLGGVIMRGIRPVALGLVLGIVCAAQASRVLSAFLFGVGARDALSFAVAPLVLLAVAIVANLVPARRATRADPMLSLRTD